MGRENQDEDQDKRRQLELVITQNTSRTIQNHSAISNTSPSIAKSRGKTRWVKEVREQSENTMEKLRKQQDFKEANFSNNELDYFISSMTISLLI